MLSRLCPRAREVAKRADEKSSALKISEKYSLSHIIEKIYSNTADLVKRQVDIALKIIHQCIHASSGKKTYLRVFLGFIFGKRKHCTILKNLLGYINRVRRGLRK